jgi:hypothetical protein
MHFSIRYTLSFLLIALAGIAVFTPGCKESGPGEPVDNRVEDFSYEAAYRWNELFLEVERYAAGYRPGPAPRALALMGLAAYEACLQGMPEYNSMAPRYSGLSIPQSDPQQVYHWPTVVNAIYGYMMPKFFPHAAADKLQAVAALEAELNTAYASDAASDVIERSKAHGIAVAAAVWNWGATDAIGYDHYLDPFEGYTWEDHYNSPGDWVPTFPGPGKPMGAVWGEARLFVITPEERLSRPPLAYSENPQSALYSQALETYAQNTPTLSHEAEWVGEFWSDDMVDVTFSPGPRWLAIGNQVLKAENSTLETALELNAKLGMALNDASVACWYSKFYYNVERPQTYINRLIDPNWKPALYNPITGDEGLTPSFPAYPSGHSTMGGAGAEVLAGIFGYAYGLTDRCHENRTDFEGAPRSFGSFFEMAQENAWSRVPIGVHFRMDSEEGVRLGTVIGRKVNNLSWKN